MTRPAGCGPPRRPGRAAAVAVAAVLALGAASPAGAASPSPLARLRSAARGTWHGRFGTLQFHTDGTARVVVLECGYLPTSPGYVKSFTDCAPDTATGRVVAVATGYQLTEADGHVASLAAYVDPAGALHLGFGAVGQLAPDRTGTITVAPGEQFVVLPVGCQDVQNGQARPIPCTFTRDHGRTILEYPTADAAVPGGTRVTGLVYVAGSRLLVSPELVDRVYTR